MERFINILIIDENIKNRKGLKEILSGGGNNILQANTVEDALPLLTQKEIGILLINIDTNKFEEIDSLSDKKEIANIKNIYKIAITANPSLGAKMVKGLNEGAVDYITTPFNPNLIRAKIEVFKSLYYKDQRINQLLNNIFPATVLEDLSTSNKFSPKRVENGIVLFTDFVDFSLKSRDIKPIRLLKKLEYYFSSFDEIIQRYKLEKIKTIGDAYMALAGVTENYPEPAVRACLAAIEIRDFMQNERNIARALNRDYWEIRIGLHMGPLVAGIIGKYKISFDVWGDTVNIAARAEQVSKPGFITITEPIEKQVEKYFTYQSRGDVSIHKRGGHMIMAYLTSLKPEYSHDGNEKIASRELRIVCGLSSIDFNQMRKDIVNRLRSLLPDEVLYHDLNHTLNVEKAAIRFAKLEGLDENSILILRTAVLYHDSGFILRYDDNEDFAIQLAKNNLPKYGYTPEQILQVEEIISSTKHGAKPKNLLEQIMCDADHDYLGRPDYFIVSAKLRIEMENYGKSMNDEEWLKFQLHYLENVHRFYTETSQNIRLQGKKLRIEELKQQLDVLTKNQA
jgi:class 3 adenylate cyclase/predicted metal-dependent HD superfamily phosphohydrolase